MDCSLPGSSVHGIFQARVLEWIAISFSRGSSRPRDWTRVSCIVGRHFTIWATREVRFIGCLYLWSFFAVQKLLVWCSLTCLLFSVFLFHVMWNPKTHHQDWWWGIYSVCFLLEALIVPGVTIKSLISLTYCLSTVSGSGPTSFYTWGCSVSIRPFLVGDVLSQFISLPFCFSVITIHTWLCSWALYSIPLIYLYLLL